MNLNPRLLLCSILLCLIAAGKVDAWQMKQGPLMTGWAALVNTNAGPVNLTVTRSGSSIVLDWPAGLLLQAPALTGPWTTNASAVSPYTVPMSSGNQFFRVLVNP